MLETGVERTSMITLKPPNALLNILLRFEDFILSDVIRSDQIELRRARLLLWVNLTGSPIACLLFIMMFVVDPSITNPIFDDDAVRLDHGKSCELALVGFGSVAKCCRKRRTDGGHGRRDGVWWRL